MISLSKERLIKALACFVAFGCLLAFVAKTWHWPVISDATLMHYALMLMEHGEVPYRQVVDINLPGAYAVEWVATHVYGDSALGWRLFDLSLDAAAAAAMISIAGVRQRIAGLFAGLLFALVHGGDGVAEAGQRDLCMTVLLLGACAFLFYALRQARWLWIVPCGLAAGAAITIKPTTLLFAAVLLGVAALHNRKSLLFGFTALLLPPVIIAVLLWREHALRAFWSTLRELLPFHASMARHTPGFLLLHAIPGPLLLLAVLGGVLFVAHRSWRNQERLILFLLVLAGLISYFAQGKAYPYHRYPMIGFLLLLAVLEFARALRDSFCCRALGIAGFAYGALWLAPSSTARALRYDWQDEPSLTALRQDLTVLGGPALSGHVQCMDTMAGCITVLDRMRLVQSTGFLYDCYFFAPNGGDEQQDLRAEFMEDLRRNPPRVFIVTDQFCFDRPAGYEKLATWPLLRSYLLTHYALAEQRSFRPPLHRRMAAGVFGYRIYVRDAPLPSSFQGPAAIQFTEQTH